MAEPFMTPRSRTYSGGELNPYSERPDFSTPPGVAMGTEPAPAGTPSAPKGNFLSGLNQVAGVLADIVEGFQRGRMGYMTTGDPRMGGDRLMRMITQQLEDSRARNEAAAERAREERKEAQKRGFEQQILLEGVKQGKITYEDALNRLKSFGAIAEEEGGLSAPAVEAP